MSTFSMVVEGSASDGSSVQDCSIPNANALGILQSYITYNYAESWFERVLSIDS